MKNPIVPNPLSERAKQLINLNNVYQGTDCKKCGRTVEAVEIAKGVDADPSRGIYTDVDEGTILLAHSDDIGDYCEFGQV